MNKEERYWIKLIGMGFLFGSFLTLLYCFIVAYINPSKTTLVDINSIGEANFEMFVLIPIIAFFGVLAIILEYIDLKKEVERRSKCQKK
jgi:drug/metabolite transporter (DMT)-like permease